MSCSSRLALHADGGAVMQHLTLDATLAVQGGVVINISAVAAWGGSQIAGISAHAAAKGAVVPFTRQLAVEGVKHKIRAVSISPGFIATPGTTEFLKNPDIRKALLDGVLMERPGESHEVLSTALFVASDEVPVQTSWSTAAYLLSDPVPFVKSPFDLSLAKGCRKRWL